MKMEKEYDQEKLEYFRQKLDEAPDSSLPAIKNFLASYFADADSWEEALDDIRHFSESFPRTVIRELQGLELFLKNPPQEEGALANLVAWEANWALDNPSDEGANEWLQKVANAVREILDDKAPPRP